MAHALLLTQKEFRGERSQQDGQKEAAHNKIRSAYLLMKPETGRQVQCDPAFYSMQ
jgi:hypothetical protein